MSDTSEIVERLTSEGLIGMRAAAPLIGARHASTPTRHALKGIKRQDGSILKLESLRSGGKLLTSKAAVLRFLAAQNSPVESGDIPPATAAGSRTLRTKASAEVGKLLGVST